MNKSFKALTKSIVDSKRSVKKNDEKKLLLSADSIPPQYGNQDPLQRSRKTSSNSSSPLPIRRANSNSANIVFDSTPMVSIRAGNHPSPPSSPKVSAVMDMDFDKVPFQFYSAHASESWKSSIVQSTALLLVCLLIPCFFILCGLCGNSVKFRYKPRMTEKERRKENLFFVLLLVITATKDSIIIMILSHTLFDSPASNYEIAYSPIVFFWALVLFALPLTLFYFADTKYVFGFDSDKKKLLKMFAQLLSNKAKQYEFKKVDDQEKYYNERYQSLSSIKGSNDEYNFLAQSTTRPLLISSIFLAVMTCIIHCLIPLFLQLMDCSLCWSSYHHHHVYNKTVNVTLPTGVYKSVIAMSALNSLLVSLFASAYFIYVILWKVAMLSEWRRFNETESETITTLVNSGPQGIAMWWKIRQTLKLFSSSSLCMSVLISKMACVVSLVLVTCLSLVLIYSTSKTDSNVHTHPVIPLMIDNMLLYISLVFIGTLSYLIGREKTLSGRIIELKQLNISYELGRLMNLEQETVENEPGIRVKVRVMRGCLMLLQELTSLMGNLERSTSSKLILICLGVASLLVAPSTFIACRFLVLRKA